MLPVRGVRQRFCRGQWCPPRNLWLWKRGRTKEEVALQLVRVRPMRRRQRRPPPRLQNVRDLGYRRSCARRRDRGSICRLIGKDRGIVESWRCLWYAVGTARVVRLSLPHGRACRGIRCGEWRVPRVSPWCSHRVKRGIRLQVVVVQR